MIRHAEMCDACGEQWRLWQVIETSVSTGQDDSVVSSVTNRKDNSISVNSGFGMSSKASWMTVAASMVMLVMVVGSAAKKRMSGTTSEPSQVVTVDVGNMPGQPTDGTFAAMANFKGELDPVVWWRGMRQRDWIAQTMPTVQTVRDGVAPLGRSIRRAVTLLATVGGDQTS